MKTLGIEIDGVLRDYLTKFDEQYRKVFISNPALVAMNDDFTVREQSDAELEELDEERKKLERELLTLPVNTSDLTNHYKFHSESIDFTATENFNHSDMGTDEILIKDIVSDQDSIERSPEENLAYFMNEKYPFQIFGNALPFKRAADALHYIQHYGKSNGLFDVVLFSTLKAQSIPATYFFLSKQGIRARHIKFVENHEEKWEHCDVLIDVNSDSLDYKPEDKTSIKIISDMTQYSEADYEFKSLFEFRRSDLLDKLFNK